MKLVVSKEVEKNEWNKKVKSLNGSVFHSYEWSKYQDRLSSNSSSVFFEIYDNDCFLGCALASELKSRFRILSPFKNSLYLSSTPLVANNDRILLFDFTKLIIEYSKKKGDVNLLINSFSSQICLANPKDLSLDEISRYEFNMNLDSSENLIWDKLKSKRRNHIRKASKSDLTIENASDTRGIESLRYLKRESARRIKNRGGPEMLNKLSVDESPLKAFLSSGSSNIFLAVSNDQPVSAGLFTYFNKEAYYMEGGQNEKGLKMRAPSLLLWEAIKYYKNIGAVNFNLGGCSLDALNKASAEHGVYSFKKSFCEASECKSYAKVFSRFRLKVGNFLKR